MKNKPIKLNSFSIAIAVLMILAFALSLSAQSTNNKGEIKQPVPPVIVPVKDTAINPHDFTDKFYAMNGVAAEYILGRRNGYDLLSVIGWSSNPYHSEVRVLATLPAYGANGEVLFFSPLGEINDRGFTQDATGMQVKELADTYPIYVFPVKNESKFSFGGSRQAALMDASAYSPDLGSYAIGLRSIVLVNYTKKAFSDEGVQMMDYMVKKNGYSLDRTPLIKSMEDLTMLEKYELVSMEKRFFWDDTEFAGTYSISPIIYQPVKGAIAPDAFLITVLTQKGFPLPGEQIFVDEFNCLRKGGNWCSEL
jgi:hypothetical protein